MKPKPGSVTPQPFSFEFTLLGTPFGWMQTLIAAPPDVGRVVGLYPSRLPTVFKWIEFLDTTASQERPRSVSREHRISLSRDNISFELVSDTRNSNDQVRSGGVFLDFLTQA